MKPPLLLFIRDSKEVRLFPDLPSLESHIEAVDVINGEYEAFSSDGQRINLVAESKLSIPRGEPGEFAPDRTRSLILDYHCDVEPRFAKDKTLEDLIVDLVWYYNYNC